MPEIPAKILRRIWATQEKMLDYCRAHALEPQLFAQADYVQVYRALQQVAEPGTSFLEWGSGVGIITIMADLLGFQACGIEIEPGLVEIAKHLAETFHSHAQFAVGSFIPDDFEWSAEYADEEFHTHPGGEDGYEGLGESLSDFDVVYAYPWPGEETFLNRVFDRYAHPGTVFITYRGLNGIHVRRKPLRKERDF